MTYVTLDSGCGIDLHKQWGRSLRASKGSQDSCSIVVPPAMWLCLWEQLCSSPEAQSCIYCNCERIWCNMMHLQKAGNGHHTVVQHTVYLEAKGVHFLWYCYWLSKRNKHDLFWILLISFTFFKHNILEMVWCKKWTMLYGLNVNFHSLHRT
jgi:hypothetical protein